jgi:hypothetical protein
MAVLRHQMGKGLGVVSTVEARSRYLLGDTLLAGDLGPDPVKTRRVQLGAWRFHVSILQEFCRKRAGRCVDCLNSHTT